MDAERQQVQPLVVPGALVDRQGRCSNIGRRGKFCIGCGICSIISLAVVIPVVVCVIVPQYGPKIAQHILDNTVIELPNATLTACSGLHSWVHNNAEIHVPGPLFGVSTTLHSYTQEVYTSTCGSGANTKGGWACDSPNVSLVGTYTQPEMSVSQGKNVKNFTVGMTLDNANIVLNGIIVPTFLSGHKAPLILRAKNIAVSVLGFKFSGLTMNNDVTCTKVSLMPNVDIPNSVCYPNDPTHAPDNEPGYYLSCVRGLNNLTAVFNPLADAVVV